MAIGDVNLTLALGGALPDAIIEGTLRFIDDIGDGTSATYRWDGQSTAPILWPGVVGTPLGETERGRWLVTDLGGATGAVTVVGTIATLKALPVGSLTNGQTIEVLGYYAAGDLGGGAFRWVPGDVTADNGGTVIAPNVGVGRWRRIVDGTILSVRWFGARGDDTVDDRPAISATIAAASPLGMTVFLPAGQYRLASTLEVADSAAAPRVGLRIVGSQGGADGGDVSCRLIWRGPGTDTVIRAWARGMVISNLAIVPITATPSCIDIDTSPLAGATATTNVQIEQVRFECRTFGERGIRIGARAAGQGNLDHNEFRDCYFDNFTVAGIDIANETGQSKANEITGCAFVGHVASRPAAVRTLTGSFHMRLSQFQGLGTALNLGNPTDVITVDGIDGEDVQRLLFVNASSVAWPVTIRGSRFALNGLHPDGRFISYRCAGPIVIDGCSFESANADNRAFKIYVGSAATPTRVTIIGCLFPNTDPIERAGYLSVEVSECIGLTYAGAPYVSPQWQAAIRSYENEPAPWRDGVGLDVNENGMVLSAALVTDWIDASGATSVAQTNGAFCPTAVNDSPIGTLVASFDGTNDHLVVADDPNLNPGTGSFIVLALVHLLAGGGATQCILGKGSNATPSNFRFQRVNDNLRLFWGTDAEAYPASAFTVLSGQSYVIGAGVDAAAGQVVYVRGGRNDENTVIDRQAVTPSGTGTNSLPARIGTDIAGLAPARMQIARMLVVRGSLVETDGRIDAVVQQWIRDRGTLFSVP